MKLSKYQAYQPRLDGTIPYTSEDDAVWADLYKRQIEVTEERACRQFIDGLDTLNLSQNRVPQPREVTQVLSQTTGWAVETVAAVIPPDEFFQLLAHKKFPAASFIRRREDMDYLQEPDIFHEVFGHCPLLTYKTYADFMQEYGQRALESSSLFRKYLFRLFWFTIEFGLIKTDEGVRILGGGILSSFQETLISLKDNVVQSYQPFELDKILRTPYHINTIQPTYFLLENFEQLTSALNKSLPNSIERAIELGDLDFPENKNINEEYSFQC